MCFFICRFVADQSSITPLFILVDQDYPAAIQLATSFLQDYKSDQQLISLYIFRIHLASGDITQAQKALNQFEHDDLADIAHAIARNDFSKIVSTRPADASLELSNSLAITQLLQGRLPEVSVQPGAQ